MQDSILLWGLRGCAAVCGSVVVLIVVFVGIEAWPGLMEIGPGRFVGDASWHPIESKFNLVPMMVATLLSTAGAVLIATPLGVMSALFCRWYAPRGVATVYRRMIELLAGLPSVVYGFWGLVTLVPLLAKWQAPGSSLLAGVLILSVMILPTVALLADAALANVPGEFVKGAAGLGLGRWGTLRRVVLPAAKSGIMTGVLLATGRAIGETMAVLMVCGNIVELPGSVFDPVRTLTANIALEMGYAYGVHRSALFVTGLLLMGLVVVLVALAEWVSRGHVRLEDG